MTRVLEDIRHTAAAAFAAALLAPAWPAPAEEKPPTNPLCALESPRYHVDFLHGQYCCPNELEFWVEDRQTGHEGSLTVETMIKRADKMILLAESKIFVTGHLGRDAKGLVIVDLEAGTLQDELHTYDYRLSPSQEQVVYSRLWEDEASAERCPLLLLYDLTASRQENRAGGAGELNIANAGIPVYPEANAREGSYDPRLESPHRYLSPFVWSDDGKRITFFESFEGKYWLVILDFSEGISPPGIRKKEVGVADLVPGAEGDVPLYLVTLYWKGEATVEVQALVDGTFRDGVDVVVR